MIRRPTRSTQGVLSAASDVYKRQQLHLAAVAALVGAQPGKEAHPGAALDPVQMGHAALTAGKNRHCVDT